MTDSDATNLLEPSLALPARSSADAKLPVSLTGSGERSVVSFEPRGLEPAEREGMQLAATGIASPLNMSSLLKAFRHRWMLAVCVGATLLFLFGGAVWFFVPAKYTAYALLRVSESEPEPLISDKRSATTAVERYFENTQVALIRSRPILLAALRQPGVSELGIVRGKDDPAAWLEDNLKVSFLDKTDILRVSLEGTQAKELAALVNAVKDAYMEEEVNGHRKKKLLLLENLERVCLSFEDKIHGQRTALRDLAQRLKSSDTQALSIIQKSALDEYAALQAQLTQLKARIQSAEIAVAVHKANGGQSNAAIPQSVMDREIDSDPQVLQMKAEMMHLDGKIRHWNGMTDPGHPTRQRLDKERKEMQEKLEQLRSSLRTSLANQVRDRMRGEQNLNDQKSQENLQVWRREEVLLKSDVEKALKRAQDIGVTAFELELKKGEFEQAEGVVKRLREERERLQVELQSSKQRISVLHPAEEPTRKDQFAKARVVGFAAALGLFVGLFGISYWEARSHRIRSKDEVVNVLGYRVVGELPWVNGMSQRGRGGESDPLALLTSSVADLRALLLCEAEGQTDSRVLMVTSAVPREGKTTLASHLAVSLAQAGRRTLLIDGDWCRPQLHQVFDLPRGPGLCEILHGTAAVDEAVQTGPVSGLSILVAGEDSHANDSAQTMNALRTLLEASRKKFDFILIDSPPLLPVADALLMGKRADAVLLSVRPSVSQFPLVAAAYERLAALRIPVLGAVVNGVPFRRGSYKAYGYELTEQT